MRAAHPNAIDWKHVYWPRVNQSLRRLCVRSTRKQKPLIRMRMCEHHHERRSGSIRLSALCGRDRSCPRVVLRLATIEATHLIRDGACETRRPRACSRCGSGICWKCGVILLLPSHSLYFIDSRARPSMLPTCQSAQESRCRLQAHHHRPTKCALCWMIRFTVSVAWRTYKIQRCAPFWTVKQ